MMDLIWKSVWKKNGKNKGWLMTLAMCTCYLFIAVGSAGAGVPVPTKDGAIGGKAWCDLNEDGKRQKVEALLPDVTVTLQRVEEDGTLTDVATTKTNAKGRYKFKRLPLGTYVVVFEDKGLAFTKANIGKDKRDSDVIDIQAGEGATGEIHLDANDPTNYSTDAGYVDCDTGGQPDKGAIGGKAWCDENEDGMRQDTESFLPGVEVTLKEVLSDGQYKLVATVTTDAQGNYKFENLPLGSYVVIFDENNLSFTSPNINDDCKDSDVVKQLDGLYCTDHILLSTDNPTSLCTDAGYVGCGTPPPPDPTCQVVASTGTTFDFTYENVTPNSSVVRNGEAIETISGAGSFSDSPGGPDGSEYEYAIESDGQIIAVCGTVTVVNPPQVLGSIGDRVWLDENDNGIQDAGEVGVEGVRVRLRSVSSGSFIAEIFTDANGNYLFENLDADDYSVLFYRPDGFFFTTANAGNNDNIDSDVVSNGGSTGTTQLGEGEHRRDVDAGLVVEPEPYCVDFGWAGYSKDNNYYGNGFLQFAPTFKKLFVSMNLHGRDLPEGARIIKVDWSPLNDLVKELTGADPVTNNIHSHAVNTGDRIAGFSQYYVEKSWAALDGVKALGYAIGSLKLDAVMKVDGRKVKFQLCAVGPAKDVSVVSPIALDTDGSGAVERIDGEFAFDFAANGELVKATEWFAPTEGILVDTRIPGSMTGAHLFGDMGGKYADGYAKLAKLDANSDGAVSGAELTGLAIWTDANSNAMADEGEISSLAAHRIVSLSTSHIGFVSEVTLADGTTMMSEDLWFPMVLPPPVAKPLAVPVSINALALGLSGAALLALLIVAAHRRRQVSVPEAA